MCCNKTLLLFTYKWYCTQWLRTLCTMGLLCHVGQDSSSSFPVCSMRVLPPPLLLINCLSCSLSGGPGSPPFPLSQLDPISLRVQAPSHLFVCCLNHTFSVVRGQSLLQNHRWKNWLYMYSPLHRCEGHPCLLLLMGLRLFGVCIVRMHFCLWYFRLEAHSASAVGYCLNCQQKGVFLNYFISITGFSSKATYIHVFLDWF